MADKQKIIQFIRSNGPSVPTQIATHLKESSFIIGALLSELARSGEVKVSKVKVGASPLYYLHEHRHKLQDFADHLNEKDKEAYDLLKQKGVLYDRDLTPLLRVSLRTITDFAVPVKVSVNNQEELFWRWYLTPLNSIEDKIRQWFSDKEKAQEEKPEGKSKEEKENFQHTKEDANEPEPPKSFNTKNTSYEPERAETKEEPKKEVQKHLAEDEPDDELHEKAKSFFEEKHIRVKSVKQVRKNQELEYEIIVPSAIGDLDYFCRAKAKKKLNENDLANAYLAGKRKELPVLLVATGELTKKAENSIPTEFPGVKVANI